MSSTCTPAFPEFPPNPENRFKPPLGRSPFEPGSLAAWAGDLHAAGLIDSHSADFYARVDSAVTEVDAMTFPGGIPHSTCWN